MRKKLYEIIDKSAAYNWFMIVIIVASLVPLGFKGDHPALHVIELVTVCIFIIDYVVRWFTADFSGSRSALASILLYPLRPMAIIDLLTILPSLILINPAFRALRILRLFRALRVFRLFRYSKNVEILVNVFKKQKNVLFAVGGFAVGYVLVSALIMFQIEPETFPSFFEALYWSTVSLTTVGYGDIFAISTAGRIMTMISAFVGIAIVALPAGVITAGYLEELGNDKSQ